MPMYDDIDQDQDYRHDFEQKFEHNFYQNVDSDWKLYTEHRKSGGGQKHLRKLYFLWSGEISCCAKSTKTKV